MSLVDYSDIQGDIENAPEPKVLPAGTEVKVKIISVRTGNSDKNDCNWFSPIFEVPDESMAKEFNSFFWELDKTHLTAKEYARTLYDFKLFAKAFGLDLSRPFDPEDDLVGLEGWVIVGVKKSEEYGEQNTIKKYIAGK